MAPVLAAKWVVLKAVTPWTITRFTPLAMRSNLAKARTDPPSLSETAVWFNTTVDHIVAWPQWECFEIFRELFRSAKSSLAHTKHSW